MRIIYIIIVILLNTLSAHCQSIADTKKFIDNVFRANPVYYEDVVTQCQIWDNADILSSDVNFYTNLQQSEDYISHFLMFKMTTKRSDLRVDLKIYDFVDARDIKDVGILFSNTDGQIGYSLQINFKKNSKSYRYHKVGIDGVTEEKRGTTGMDHTELVFPNNKEEALRVKKAILHLISLKGGNASDGDIF